VKRAIIIIWTLPVILFSKIHYAKVEPYEIYTIKSATSGEVILSRVDLEGKEIKNKTTIVQLDDKLDKIDLKLSKEKLNLLNRTLEINKDILTALQESLQREEEYYYRIENLPTIPKSKRDSTFYSYINTKTKYLSTKEKIENLKREILNLKFKIETLKDKIDKKRVSIKKRFIYKILVHKRDFVNIGTPLATLANLTKAKLVIFLEKEELEDIKSKKIYIEGKETNYKISKIWKISDEKFISSYRAEIIINNPKYQFSTLLKVELK